MNRGIVEGCRNDNARILCLFGSRNELIRDGVVLCSNGMLLFYAVGLGRCGSGRRKVPVGGTQ